ncbi:TPA: hypothetical protein PPD39_001870 [Acinetobacter baumannii]|nr:hypothetical protein [Acinetobacter baumannii]
MNSPVLNEEYKNLFRNEYAMVILQKDLNLNEENLPLLLSIKKSPYARFMVYIYKNCKHLLKFDSIEGTFKLIKPISRKYAKRLEIIGTTLFFSIGFSSYMLILYMLYIYKIHFKNIYEILIWAGINYFIMLAIIFIAFKILRFFLRYTHALKFIELSIDNVNT